MDCVTIRHHNRTAGLVEMEVHNTDTDGVSGVTLKTQDVWPWLWERRPCRVRVGGHTYWLERPEARIERMAPRL